ncbi:hypothetical protein KCU78_g56, partial [Aureobasidium melanogenum]
MPQQSPRPRPPPMILTPFFESLEDSLPFFILIEERTSVDDYSCVMSFHSGLELNFILVSLLATSGEPDLPNGIKLILASATCIGIFLTSGLTFLTGSIAMWFVFDIASREFREFCNNVFLNLTLCCTLLKRYSLSLQEWSTQLLQDSFDVRMTIFLDQTGFCRCRLWRPLAFFFPSVYQGSSYDDLCVNVRISILIYAVANGVTGKEDCFDQTRRCGSGVTMGQSNVFLHLIFKSLLTTSASSFFAGLKVCTDRVGSIKCRWGIVTIIVRGRVFTIAVVAWAPFSGLARCWFLFRQRNRVLSDVLVDAVSCIRYNCDRLGVKDLNVGECPVIADFGLDLGASLS